MSTNSHGRFWLALIALWVGLFAPTVTHAHEVRPAYLQIDEIAPGRYQLIWRTPVLAGMRLPVGLRFPANVRTLTTPGIQELSDSIVERSIVDSTTGLAGKRIEFVGLQGTVTDVLVRVQMLDGTHSTNLVHPSEPWVDIAARQGSMAIFGTYVLHGVEHILFGFDHLLFVLALMMLVQNLRVLFFAVTAFTLAHSITLALATLGIVHVPGPPVEACIALSILLLAGEIIRLKHGQPSLTANFPWLVAFSFGLLHGLGFASALIDIGLPQRDIPLALFAFNAGVELGQLAFIVVVLCSVWSVQQLFRMPLLVKNRLRVATTYFVGTTAAFWFIERLAVFWT